MNSKIIQISTVSSENTPYVYALCEDGSVWRKFGLSGEWKAVSEPFENNNPEMLGAISGGN